MIFPYLRGIVWPHLAPVTWLLFLLNVLVFVATLESFETADSKVDAILQDKSFTATQGFAFATMVKREPASFSTTLQKLSVTTLAGDRDARTALGSLALRDPVFAEKADAFDFGGNEVAIKAWRAQYQDLRDQQDEHPSYRWGLSTRHDGWLQWVSYQFAHAGASHLFWNMLFLLIFGTFLEIELGASLVAIAYVGGGLFGALAYSVLSGVSSSPLIGASAAVSGLMGLVAAYWWKREPIAFIYWLLPVRGYYGIARLPGWIVLVVSLLPDLSGYLSASREFGSVAYSAHIGGALFGATLAGALVTGVMHREANRAVATRG